jgi:hypothetical protein
MSFFLVTGLLPRDVRPRQAPACLTMGAFARIGGPDGQEPVKRYVPGREPCDETEKKRAQSAEPRAQSARPGPELTAES